MSLVTCYLCPNSPACSPDNSLAVALRRSSLIAFGLYYALGCPLQCSRHLFTVLFRPMLVAAMLIQEQNHAGTERVYLFFLGDTLSFSGSQNPSNGRQGEDDDTH